MEHFVCGVLAAYGLVVACGNMETQEILSIKTDESNGEQSCFSKLYKKNTPGGNSEEEENEEK